MLDLSQLDQEREKGQFIVGLVDDVLIDDDVIVSIFQAHGAKIETILHQINAIHIQLPDEDGVEHRFAADMAETGLVAYIEPNRIGQLKLIPNDTNYGSEYHLPLIGCPAMWDVTTGSSRVVLGHLDSGFTPTADSTTNILQGYNFVNGNTITTDQIQNGTGHGSCTANLVIALLNNGGVGGGYAGIVPGIFIMPIVIADQFGASSDVRLAQGILFGADNGCHVLTMSLSFNGTSALVQAAVDHARARNSSLVAAGGNYSGAPPSGNAYPAGCAGVIGVSGTDSGDHPSTFSTIASFIDIAAPATAVYLMGEAGTTGTLDGESFAAPIVAAVLCAIKSVNFGLSNVACERILLANTDPGNGQTVFPDTTFGYGRVNASKSVIQAASSVLFWSVFDNFRLIAVKNGALNLASGGASVHCALITSAHAPVATDTVWPGLYTEVSGTNYTAGGIDISLGQSVALTGDAVEYSSTTPIKWLYNPGGFTNARFAILYDSVTGDLIAWSGLGADYGNSNTDLGFSMPAGILLS